MKQLLLGAALVGTGTSLAQYPQTPPTAQPTLSSLHPAFNQAMLCGIYQGSGTRVVPTCQQRDEYVRVTWTR